MSKQTEKNCVRDWVRNPETGKWIQVNGKTYNNLIRYSKHKIYFSKAEIKSTPGRLWNGICVVKPGGPRYDVAVASNNIGLYNPYWYGPPCYSDPECWEGLGYRRGIDFGEDLE